LFLLYCWLRSTISRNRQFKYIFKIKFRSFFNPYPFNTYFLKLCFQWFSFSIFKQFTFNISLNYVFIHFRSQFSNKFKVFLTNLLSIQCFQWFSFCTFVRAISTTATMLSCSTCWDRNSQDLSYNRCTRAQHWALF
jgi:hypothetical protein